eukprot:jgi/Chrzof1/13230/Cz07g25150.t1
MAQATAIEQLMVKVPEILKGERQERISRAINTVAQRFSEASAAEYFALESTAPNELKAALLQQADKQGAMAFTQSREVPYNIDDTKKPLCTSMAPTTAVRQLLIKVPQLLQGASDERIGKVLFAIAWHLPESTAQGLMEIHSTAPNVLRAALLQLAGDQGAMGTAASHIGLLHALVHTWQLMF